MAARTSRLRQRGPSPAREASGDASPAPVHSSSTVRRRPRITTRPTAMITTSTMIPRTSGSDEDDDAGLPLPDGAGVATAEEPPGEATSDVGAGDGWALASVKSV